MTKKQRENAAKKAKEQAAKDSANQEQEERLRQYRREQDKAKCVHPARPFALRRSAPRPDVFFGGAATGSLPSKPRVRARDPSRKTSLAPNRPRRAPRC